MRKEIFELLLLGKSSETFSTKTPPQFSPSNFTTRFWVVAGPKISISLEIFNLDLQNSPQEKIGVWWVARLKSSISLENFNPGGLVAQCSATPASVLATPPCSATPFQTQISVRHLPAQGGGRCDTKIFRGCSATPVLHLQNAIKSRKSAATRGARQGVPAIMCN